MNLNACDFSCDLVIVGGGLAALSAAISAADDGATVLVVNKGVTGNSGSSVKAAGILAAPFGHGDLKNRPVLDTPNKHAQDTLRVGHHIGDTKLVHFVAQKAISAIEWLGSLGIEFSRASDGGYVQLNAPGNSCPRAVSALGGGKAMISALIHQAKKRSVMILDETIARDITLTKNQRFLVTLQANQMASVTASALVLAAGGATGLFPTVSGDEGNIGTSLMLGYNVGVALKNLEFVEFTLIYRVRSQTLRVAGMAPFLSRGGKLTNRHGKDLFESHFPNIPAEQTGRAEILRAVEHEIVNDRGPVHLDCAHFSNTIWEEFESSQGSTILNQLANAGCDYRNEKIEVIPAAHSVLAGIEIDTDAQTKIPGIFAAGENATGIHGAGRLSGNGLTACVVMGRVAGKNASDYAKKIKMSNQNLGSKKNLDTKLLSQLRPTNKEQSDYFSGSPSIQELMAKVRKIVGDNLGIIRNGLSLTEAKNQLDSLWSEVEYLDEQKKDIFELQQMVRLARLMVDAAERRKESRGVQFRSDFDVPDDSWVKPQTLLKN